MRRLAAVAIACLLTPLFVLPASASVDVTTLNTNFNLQVGAGRALPGGQYGMTDGCETGLSATMEFRCSFEFDLSSIISSSKIIQATLTITRTGGCPTNDCQISIASFRGNGSADLGDVVAGGAIATWTPTNNSPHNFNVLGLIQAHRDNGESWAGFNLGRGASTRSPDVQDFSLSDSDLKLTVAYIPLPVDITVSKDGTGQGKITSSIEGINCGSTCTGTFTFSEPLTLTATAATGSKFLSWSGIDCDGGNQATTCTFIVPSVPDPIVATFSGTAAASPPHPTPHPTPTKASGPSPHASTAPPSQAALATSVPTAAPAVSEAPAGTFAPGETVGPTLQPTTPTADSGGPPLGPIIVIVGVVLAIAIGVGAYLYARRRQEMLPPSG